MRFGQTKVTYLIWILVIHPEQNANNWYSILNNNNHENYNIVVDICYNKKFQVIRCFNATEQNMITR